MFEKGQTYNTVGIDGTHTYSFGKLVLYTERDNTEVTKECIVTGETPWLVDVLFFKDFHMSENYITPNHIFKSRISTMEGKNIIMNKAKLMSFMSEINYISYCHDETTM